MGGLGGAEFAIVIIAVLVLFGPALIAFWLGYTLGQKKPAEAPPRSGATAIEPDSAPELAPVEPTPDAAVPIEPADESPRPEEPPTDE